MSDRRSALRALAAGLAGFATPARAQPARERRVAILWSAAPDEYLDRVRSALAEQGFVEGRTLAVDVSRPALDSSDVAALVEDALHRGPDLVIAQGPVVVAVHRAVAQRAPLVVAFSGDPVAAGLADSLRLPGRRATGVSLLVLELVGKRLEMLVEVIPHARRAGVLYSSEHYGYRAELDETARAARALKLLTVPFDVCEFPDVVQALDAILRAKVDGLVVAPDGALLGMASEIGDFGRRRKLPVIGGWELFTRAGALASCGPDLPPAYDRVGGLAARVLKGADASVLPIERPARICTSVNRQTARSLGIVLPPALLARADSVV